MKLGKCGFRIYLKCSPAVEKQGSKARVVFKLYLANSWENTRLLIAFLRTPATTWNKLNPIQYKESTSQPFSCEKLKTATY